MGEGDGFLGIFAPAEPALEARHLAWAQVHPDDSCRYAKDGLCDYDSNRCEPGTDCTDCRDCMARGSTSDSCQYSRDGVCDEPPMDPYYCYTGTDCTDCGTCSQRSDSRRRTASGGIPAWKQKTLQLAV